MADLPKLALIHVEDENQNIRLERLELKSLFFPDLNSLSLQGSTGPQTDHKILVVAGLVCRAVRCEISMAPPA
jgi:hypothetical protein